MARPGPAQGRNPELLGAEAGASRIPGLTGLQRTFKASLYASENLSQKRKRRWGSDGVIVR